jgi:hypothetical protein
MAAPFTPCPYRVRRTRDVIVGVFAAHLFWAYMAYCQRSGASFGPYVETRTPALPIAVTVHTSSLAPLPTILVAYADRSGVDEFALTSGGRCVRQSSYATSRDPGYLTLADVDSDGESELLILSVDGYHLEIQRPDEGERAHTLYKLEHRAERLVVADINNDGRKDILFFGRHMAGVGTLLGARTGVFREGPLLFPESSAGDLVALDLNGDRIMDLVMVNWLSDRMAVYFGIGQCAFSEQVSLMLPAEPGRLSVTTVQKRQVIRVLVTLPGLDAVAHIVGNPAGEFSVHDTIPVPGHPDAVSFSFVNEDQLPDMVVSTSRGLAVALGATSTTFGPLSMFGAGAGSTSWTLADVDGDHKTDIVIADAHENRIVILGNAQQSGLASWPAEYATGVHPEAVTVADWTGDGVEDLLVANSGSSSIGLFEGTIPGRLVGQRTVTVPGEPEDVRVVPGDPGKPWTIVTVDPVREQIGIVRRAERFEMSRVLMIPTAPAPRFLTAETDRASGRLVIAVRNGSPASNRAPLAMYQELSAQQFVEKTYRAPLGMTITAMTTGDFTGNGKPDAMLALKERSPKHASVALAPAQQDYDFRRIQRMLSLPDSTMGIRLLATGRVDDDTTSDLLIFSGPPQRKLLIAYGGVNGSFDLDSTLIDGVDPIDEDGIIVRDVNEDGRADVVYLDGNKDGIYALFGIGPRHLAEPVLILPAGGAEHFALRTSPVTSSLEIVLTHPKKHTVTLHQGVFTQ